MRKDIRIYTTDEIVQGTPEWFRIRELKFTGSRASEVASNGKGLDTLVTELLASHFSSQQYEEYTGKYKSAEMQRGNDYEPMARMVYEFETGNTVREIGFVEDLSRKYVGYSPDGFVTEDGNEDILFEAKNHNDKVFMELLITGKVDSKYVKQMQYGMWVTGAKACDYFGFNPNFKPNYFLKRFYPDEKMFNLFEDGIKSGTQMIENGLTALAGKIEPQEKITEPKKETELSEDINKDEFPF